MKKYILSAMILSLIFIAIFKFSISDEKKKKKKLKFLLEESDEHIISNISNVDSYEDRLLISDQNASSIGIYNLSGKLLSRFVIGTHFTDSLAMKGVWPNDKYVWVPLSDVDSSQQRDLSKAITHQIIDAKYLDYDNIVIGCYIQGLLGRNLNIQSIGLNSCLITLNINNKSCQLIPFNHTPFGMAKLSELAFNRETEFYYAYGYQSRHLVNNNYDSLVSVIEYDSDLNYVRPLKKYPKILIDAGLVGYYKPLIEIIRNEVVITYNGLPTIFIPDQNIEFDLELDNSNNRKLFEGFANIANKDSLIKKERAFKKRNTWIYDLSHDSNDKIVVVCSVRDSSQGNEYFVQKYDFDGNLLSNKVIDISKINGEIESLFYLDKMDRIAIFTLEDENWYVNYLNI